MPTSGVPRLRAIPLSESGTILDDPEEEEEEDQDLSLNGEIDWTEEHHFAVLDSSLVRGEGEAQLDEGLLPLVRTPFGPRPHVLKSYERSMSHRSRAYRIGWLVTFL